MSSPVPEMPLLKLPIYHERDATSACSRRNSSICITPASLFEVTMNPSIRCLSVALVGIAYTTLAGIATGTNG